MNIAVSGMQAASLQLSAAASNIVNMNDSGAVPGTPPDQAVAQVSGAVYQPLTVSQSTTPRWRGPRHAGGKPAVLYLGL